MWYHIGANHSTRAIVNWLISLWFHTNTHVYNIVKTNSKKHLFIALVWRIMFILQNKGFHELVLTILPRSLFNTLIDLSYFAFVSKLFIFNYSLILRSCLFVNFASVFGCSQLNRLWQYLECSVACDAIHIPVILSSWCSIDRVSMSWPKPLKRLLKSGRAE